MDFRKLSDLELTGKSAFIRLDLNVPIKDGKITDDTRITAALPTIRAVLEKTGRIVMASHLGRPKGKVAPELSLEPVGVRLAELLGVEVILLKDYVEEPYDQFVRNLQNNQIVLLENLRFQPGETKNEPGLAAKLAKGMDVYINDAFGTAHRAHASTHAVAEKIKPENRAAGLLMEKEVSALTKVKDNPEAPFVVIMGGAKVSDKIGVILNLLETCNDLIIGGAMAYTFLKHQGHDVGSSRVEADKMALVDSIYRVAEARKVNIHLPKDHVCAAEFSQDAEAKYVSTEAIPEGLMGLDIGEKTIVEYEDVIGRARTVLWNGPMGVFEWKAFAKGTLEIARQVAECRGTSIVGGGDSVAAANAAGVADRISHVSTGGGASLEFLEGSVLPGLKVLAR